MQAIIDTTLNKYVSRKLQVAAVGTVAWLGFQRLDGEQWLWLSCVYIGTQGAIDAFKVLRK